MEKKIILWVAIGLMLIAIAPVEASDIVVSRERMKYFIGTFDAASKTFTDFDITGWNDNDPMSYVEKIGAMPKKNGIYYGIAPWYANMAEAILELPKQGIAFVSLIDMKSEQKVKAIITKWIIEGENYRLVCIGDNFPGIDAAVNLDGCFVMPDSSRLIVARSGGGDMHKIWRRYMFIIENEDCQWEMLYNFESARLPYETEFTEGWCAMVSPITPEYIIKLTKIHYKAVGEANPDGSYSHEVSSNDSSFINLWDLAKKIKFDK